MVGFQRPTGARPGEVCTRGTEVRQVFGLEAAQVALGHSNAPITEVYAERNMNLAARVAREVG